MYRVLYVDDEPDLLAITKLFLEESKDFIIETATSARDVLDSANLSSYDAIISDYQMPGLDGIAFLKEVRSGFGDIPFILFTGRGREEIAIEAMNNGADFYIQKGGDPQAQFAELKHKIRMAIQRRESAQQLIVQNRLYSVLSAANKAVVHIRKKNEFFSEMCRILVEIGGFRMVWIGRADATNRKIVPVAWFGHIDGYLDKIDISTGDDPHGRGPAGTAYREGRYYFSNDIRMDPNMAPWREAALQCGYLATAAFPFAVGTENAGVICLYAPKTGFFDERVVHLLEEMSRDISFAISTIDEEDHRKSAEIALRESEARFKNIYYSSPVAIELFNEDGYLIDVNPAAAVMFGIQSAGEVKGFRIFDDPNIPKDELERLKQDEILRYETDFDFDLVNRLDLYHTTRSGTIALDVLITPIRQAGHTVSGYLVQIVDISERKRAEEALKESEKVYHNLFNNTEVAMFRSRLDGSETLDANEKFLRIVGLTREEVIGKPSVVYWADPGQREEMVRRLLADGRVIDFEYKMLNKSGEIRDCITSLNLYREEGILAGSILDVTEQKRWERELRESEKKFATIFNSNPVALSLVSAVNGAFVDVNDAFLENTGYSRPEVIGKTTEELGLISEKGEYERMASLLQARKSLSGMEVQCRFKGGEVRTCRFSSNIITMGGKPFILSIVEDVTERKGMEEALGKSEARFHGMVERSTALIVIFDETMSPSYVSPSSRAIIGYDPRELVGKPLDYIAERIFSKTGPELRAVLEAGMDDGTTGSAGMQISKKDKTPVYVDAFIVPILHNGKFSGAQVAMRDISARTRAENACRQANRQLKLMTSITRHDILNKVSIIRGYLGLAEKKYPDPGLADMFGKMKSAISAIESQIEFTRIYQDLGTNEPRWQDLGTVIPRSQVPAGIALDSEVSGIRIFGDPMLEKVFFNLLDNSVRHGGHVTSIKVTAKQSDEGLTIFWDDNGVGIPADEKDEIFDRGFGKNTGLGMFLAREILSLTGIGIKETGTPGKGARFEIFVKKGAYQVS